MQTNSLQKQNIRIRSYSQSPLKEKDLAKLKVPQKRHELKTQIQKKEDKYFPSALEIILNTRNTPIQLNRKYSPACLGLSNKKSRVLTLGKQNSQYNAINSNVIKTPTNYHEKPIENIKMFPSVFSNQTRNEPTSVWNGEENQNQTFASFNVFNDKTFWSMDQQQYTSGKQIHDQQNTIFTTQNNGLNLTRSCWFTIQNVFTVNYQPSSNKKSIQTQTNEASLDDKYYLSYVKQRTLKEKTFEDMLFKEKKLQSLIKQTQIFKQNYQDLFEYVHQGPSNDRQQRVYALAIDLQKQQKHIKQIFDQITSPSCKFQTSIFQKLQNHSTKSSILTNSIHNLTYACVLQLNEQTQNLDQIEGQISKDIKKHMQQKIKKITRILSRVAAQSANLFQSFSYFRRFEDTVVKKYREEVTLLKNQHNEWTNLQYQNKVLLFNFVNRLKEFPALALSLLGEVDKEKTYESEQANKIQVTQEERFDAYMKVKCESCYEMKYRVGLLKENNEKIKPVFKVIEWLIRDASKPKKSLELI